MKIEQIPKKVADVVASGVWPFDEYSLSHFKTWLSYHCDKDGEHGFTSSYVFYSGGSRGVTGLSHADILALTSTLPGWAFKKHTNGSVSVNQHVVHSFQQFLSSVQRAWAEHSTRIASLEGTPSGRADRTA